MTDRPQNLIAEELPLDLLKSNWDSIAQVAPQIANEIEIKSEGLSGNFYREALAASQFLFGDPDYEKALNQPCVLAILNPLARLASVGPVTENEIAKAVSAGLCTLSRHGTTHRSLLRIFIYPILLTYFAAFASILVSHFILPYFEQMYAEFGIILPGMTQMFFILAYAIRTYTITILLVLLGLPPLLWLVNWIGHDKRPPGMSRLDVLLSRKRPSAARWLLHHSLLLEAGLSNDEAIGRASTISGKGWLRKRAAARSRQLSAETLEAKIRFFDRQKYRMADTAISMPRSRGKVALLQNVATWYRDSSSNYIEWLVQLLIPIYVGFILLMFAALILSLLFPIVAVLRGLMGGGMAPGGFF